MSGAFGCCPRSALGFTPWPSPGVAPFGVGRLTFSLPVGPAVGAPGASVSSHLSPLTCARHLPHGQRVTEHGVNVPPAATSWRAVGNVDGRPWPSWPGSCPHSPLALNLPPLSLASFQAGPGRRLLKRRNIPKSFFESFAWLILQRPEITLVT